MPRNVFDRPTLTLKSRRELEEIADQMGIRYTLQVSDEIIIERILKRQKNETEFSSFVSAGDKKKPSKENKPVEKTPPPPPPETEENDNSSFLNSEDGQDDHSGFVTSNDDHTEDDNSGFVTSNDDNSGFVTNNDDNSGFVTADDNQSGFVTNNDNDASGFISEEDQHSSFQSIDDGGSSFIGEETATPKNRPTNGEKTVHGIAAGDSIQINGQTYTIQKVISNSSREAVIYQVKNTQGKVLALKLYREHRNKRHEPNTVALSRISEINDPDILKLHDFGTGDKKHLGKYCFEISDFALGGNLLDVVNFKALYTPQFIEETVVSEIFKGIKKLHEKKIFHCDLKPQNIFFLEQNQSDLVIGDYGSSKTFEEGSEDQAKQFGTVIATHAYMPPEQGKGIISEKVDYYAFGMILLHLLYPEHFAQKDDFAKTDPKKVSDIVEKQYAQKPIIHFNPAYERLNELIGGLTLFIPQNRWGREEVEKWIRKEPITVRYQGESLINPINVNYPELKQISSPDDLIFAIYNYSDRWYEDLILDEQGFRGLLDWVYSRSDVGTKRVFEQMIKYYRPDGKEYVQEAIVRYFHPNRPVVMGTKSYKFYENPDLKATIIQFFNDLDLIWKKTPLETLRQVIFQLEFALRQAEPFAGKDEEYLGQLLSGISQKLGAQPTEDFSDLKTQFHRQISLKKDDHFQSHRKILEMIYLLNPARPFKDLNNQPYQTLEEVGLFYARNESLFENFHLWIEKGYFLANHGKAELASVKYKPFLFGIFEKQTKTHLSVEKVKVDKDRKYTTHYTYQKSLSDYLKSQKIPKSLMEEGNGKLTHQGKKGVFQTAFGMFNLFLKDIQKKHNLPDQVLNPANVKEIKRKFVLNGIAGNIGHHASEVVAAAILLLPLIGAGSLFVGKIGGNKNIAEQLFQSLAVGEYIINSEENFSQVQGFYPFLIFFTVFYLVSLIPKLWAGKNLEIMGSVKPSSPRLLTIQGGSGFSFIALMIILPFIFAGANWLYELFGAGLLFGAFFILQDSSNKSEGKGRAKRKTIALMLLLAILGRLAFEVWSFVEFGQTAWENEPPYRGGIDFGFYLLALFLFFIPTIYYQFFKAHQPYQLLVKFLLLGGLAGLLIIQGGISIPDFSFKFKLPQGFTGEPFDKEKMLTTIKDRYEFVNLREGQGSKTPIIRPVQKGERFLTRMLPDDSWWLVVTCDGTEGYMYSSMIQFVDSMRQSDIDNFMMGIYPCSEEEEPVTPEAQALLSPLPSVNYEGMVGKLKADFYLTQRGDLSLGGKYNYPSRNPENIYELKGETLPEGRMLIQEYTNGRLSAECDLTYQKSQRCYVGVMKNTDGRNIDMRICGDEFNHPAPDIRFQPPPEPQKEEPEEIPIQEEETRDLAFIQGSNVNIRKTPTTMENNILTRLQNGDEVEVLERKRVQGDSKALATRNQTTLTTEDGQKIILNSGKAVALVEKQGRRSLVIAKMNNGDKIKGYVASRDLRSVASEIWFRIKHDRGEGWVMGDYLTRQD
jgi:serine/threonine protein kinase